MKLIKILSGVGLATTLAVGGLSAQAAQVLKPKSTTGTALASQDGGSTVSVPIGTTLFFDLEYSVNGTQTRNEAGIGVKIGYDTNFFDVVVPASQVSALHTKCMIASPSDQATSGTQREVVFGWIDTSIRTTPSAGAVGWPGTADPASPGAANGCLNPGNIVTESASLMASDTGTLNLFRIGLKAKSSGLTVGATSTVTINTAGNISYANTGNTDTSKTINVSAAAAPACNLDVDGVAPVDTDTDGLIIRRIMAQSSAARIEAARALGSSRTAGMMTADIDSYGLVLDIDGDGVVDTDTDGLAIRRAMAAASDTRIGSSYPTTSPIYVGRTAAQVGAEVRLRLQNRCGFVGQ